MDVAAVNGEDILVVDAGSSSLHLTVLDWGGRELAAKHLTKAPGAETADTIAAFLHDAPPVGATDGRRPDAGQVEYGVRCAQGHADGVTIRRFASIGGCTYSLGWMGTCTGQRRVWVRKARSGPFVLGARGPGRVGGR